MKKSKFINILIITIFLFLLCGCSLFPGRPDPNGLTFSASNISLKALERSYDYAMNDTDNKFNYYDRTSSYLYAKLIDDSYFQDNPNIFRSYALDGIKKRLNKNRKGYYYLIYAEYDESFYDYSAINNTYSLGTLEYSFIELEEFKTEKLQNDEFYYTEFYYAFYSKPTDDIFNTDKIQDKYGKNLWYNFSIVSRDIQNVEINKSDLIYDIEYRHCLFHFDSSYFNIIYNIKTLINGEYIEIAEIVVRLDTYDVELTKEEIAALIEDSSLKNEKLEPLTEYFKWIPEKFIETAEVVTLHAYKNA